MSETKEITQRIFLSQKEIAWCVKCNRRLMPGNAIIPQDKSTTEEISSLECPRCHMVYLREDQISARMLTNCCYIITNELNGETEWKYARKDLEREAKQRHTELQQLLKEQQYHNAKEKEREIIAQRKQRCEQLLTNIKTSQFCAVLQHEDGKETDVVIVYSLTFANRDKHIMYYLDPDAKALMTRVFHTDIPGQYFEYRGQTVTAVDIIFHPKRNSGSLFFAKKILLKKGGGYYNSNKPDAILATAMVYSPFSGTYEPLMVSYDEISQNYYVDPEKFRTFLHEHGNPELPIAVNSKGSSYSYWGFGDLNEQSFLTGFGYNVNSNENLSRATRHEMLTELVDLGIAQPQEIVNHLNWCIRFFAADKYRFAREKWEEDAAYISFYKANPDRFLIASSVGK